MSKSKSNENKNIKALFSVVCLCIISLGLIIYYSTATNSSKKAENPVNEQTTIKVATEVQNPVTIAESTTAQSTTATKSHKETTTTEPSTMEQGESNTPYKSYYKYPLTDAVQSGYSEELVYNETMADWRAHPAIDFKGEEGDKVVAINDGLVIDVISDSLLGDTVVIDHGGKLVAKYSGLKNVTVKKGSFVNIGNKIGSLGEVPFESSAGAHLHFETLLDGKSVNPLEVMGKIE